MSWLTANARATFRRTRVVALAFAVGLSAACGNDTPTAPTPPAIQPFTMQCPADVLGQSSSGTPVAIQVPAPTTTGGVFPVTVSCSPAGTPFPIGTTRIACSASDARGFTATRIEVSLSQALSILSEAGGSGVTNFNVRYRKRYR